ncbi:MAG: histidine kinase, partial [Actinomycetota bacterium]|nr:histidine kinase [Actinomycetota bacterium]
QLVALKIQLSLVEQMADDGQPVAAMLAQLKQDTTDALETLRDLARGIYPPLLASEGLPAALAGHARKLSVPVEIDADGVGRYPKELEAAVYFCCLEALQNVSKYARASRVKVSLGAADGSLVFSVGDDGCGFDPDLTPRGSGSHNMADRVEALDGTLEIRSQPGAGTTVVGRIPCSTPDRPALADVGA